MSYMLLILLIILYLFDFIDFLNTEPQTVARHVADA
jgi:hypothetical protein